jgi:transcriptional regulator with XRE-family HTH domain
MTFGEKLKKSRLAQNLSQIELAEKVGITERTLYNYEQDGTFPRTNVVEKLADVLGVTVRYLMVDEEKDTQKNIDQELFLANVKSEFGARGAKQAAKVLDDAGALFAGGDLTEDAKDLFFQSLMEIYMESKAKAREKFSPKRPRGRKLKRRKGSE